MASATASSTGEDPQAAFVEGLRQRYKREALAAIEKARADAEALSSRAGAEAFAQLEEERAGRHAEVRAPVVGALRRADRPRACLAWPQSAAWSQRVLEVQEQNLAASRAALQEVCAAGAARARRRTL